MMEFPTLGENCKICNDLDFLPVACKHCQAFFCKIHFQPVDHNCEIDLKETESNNIPDDKLIKIKKISCAQCKNKCTSLEIVYCVECKLSFCFEHRLQEAHNCFKLLKEKDELLAKSKKKFVPKNVEPVKVRGAKNDALSLKVALMKLKQKAKGPGIPIDERIYFYIQNNTNNQNSIHEYYLCKKWTIGRCVSFLADELKIKNNNDKLDAEKLILKLTDNAEEKSILEFERTLEEYTLKELCNQGQKLIITYQNKN